jgi:hypothetical protein
MAAFQSGTIHIKSKSTTQANADAGWLRVYAKSDGSIYRKDENGVEYRFIGDTEVASISGSLQGQINGLSSNLGALTDVTLTAPVSGNVLSYDGSEWVNKKNYRFITATYDGAGSDIDLNKVVVARVPYNGIIESWNIWSTTTAVSGSVDVWKSTTIPTSADNISATNPLQLINQSTNSGTPTGWTTSTITDGDYIAFNTTAISGCSFLSLTLKVETY